LEHDVINRKKKFVYYDKNELLKCWFWGSSAHNFC